jgi:hypothetical protein
VGAFVIRIIPLRFGRYSTGACLLWLCTVFKMVFHHTMKSSTKSSKKTAAPSRGAGAGAGAGASAASIARMASGGIKRSLSNAGGEVAWTMDVTPRAKEFLEESMVNLACTVLSSSIRGTRVDCIRGEAHIMYDSTDTPVDFVSHMAFNLYFIVNVHGTEEVIGRIALTDSILQEIQTIETNKFNFTWEGLPQGHAYHQAKSLFQSQRCRRALAGLYVDYWELCQTYFLHMDTASNQLDPDYVSLGGSSQTLSTTEGKDLSLPNPFDDDEENFDI